jgi:hypothetical protein
MGYLTTGLTEARVYKHAAASPRKTRPVIPAKAGIQLFNPMLDSGLRRNDEERSAGAANATYAISPSLH